MTTKTAWITIHADTDPRRRAELNVAAARLLLRVTQELKPMAELASEIKRQASRRPRQPAPNDTLADAQAEAPAEAQAEA